MEFSSIISIRGYYESSGRKSRLEMLIQKEFEFKQPDLSNQITLLKLTFNNIFRKIPNPCLEVQGLTQPDFTELFSIFSYFSSLLNFFSIKLMVYIFLPMILICPNGMLCSNKILEL